MLSWSAPSNCVLYIGYCCKFKEVPILPSRSVVDCNMLLILQDIYPSTQCIVGATEVFIQKPQNPSTQHLTFSSYKNQNMFNGLVGITPSGAICFVSELFGGNISDKELTA